MPLMACRRAVEESTEPSVKDLDDAVEAFMKRQAELESGGEMLRLLVTCMASFLDPTQPHTREQHFTRQQVTLWSNMPLQHLQGSSCSP